MVAKKINAVTEEPAKKLHCLLFFLDSLTFESRILGMSCVCQYFSGWQENRQKHLRPGKNMPCRYIVHISASLTPF